MADISKCLNEECELKTTCYRYLAPSNPWRQSYILGKCINGRCKDYMDVNFNDKFSRLEGLSIRGDSLPILEIFIKDPGPVIREFAVQKLSRFSKANILKVLTQEIYDQETNEDVKLTMKELLEDL